MRVVSEMAERFRVGVEIGVSDRLEDVLSPRVRYPSRKKTNDEARAA